MKSSLSDHLFSPFTDPDKKRSSYGDAVFTLDGVRGIAVLIVMFSHTGFLGMQGQGSLGVFLFFVLSGFVLTLPFADDPRRLLSGRELKRYAANRILRIVPLYVVAVLVIADIRGFPAAWVIDNVTFLKGWNHLWSVAEEVRFYLLFPLVIFICAWLPSRWSRIGVLIALTGLAWAYRNVHQIDMMNGRFVAFYFAFFLAGMVACLIYTRAADGASNRAHQPALSALAVGASGLILLSLFLTSDQVVEAAWRPLMPGLLENTSLNGWNQPGAWLILLSLFLLAVTVFSGTLTGRLVQSWPLRHIGLLSYSLYLFHIPVIILLRRWGLGDGFLFPLTFLITYGVALFTYVVIEKPFLALKPRHRASSSPPD